MLATYPLPSFELPKSMPSKNNCFFGAPDSNGAHSDMVGDYIQPVCSLAGAYQFFQVDKAVSKQHYTEPSNPNKNDNPSETVATKHCANSNSVLCKDFRYVLLAEEEDDEEEESDVDEDFLEDDDEDDDDDDAVTSVDKWDHQPESPQKLLTFASGVTSDLQSYFTRNKQNEDYCDVFEDKYKSVQSGRELYYADLLLVAQYGDNGKGKGSYCKDGKANKTRQTKMETQQSHTISTSDGSAPCLLPHRGTLNSELGLGPYQELFDSVLREPLIIKDEFSTLATSQFPMMRYNASWSAKKFPPSFWSEPGDNMQRDLVQPTVTNQTMDFSDLLAQW